MTRFITAVACIFLLASCKNSLQPKVFAPDALLSQSFSIDIFKDTTLQTSNGAIIKIPAGALQSSDSVVQLEIKEAYHISEILRAGLLTQSNGQTLSSGGMIYIDAKGENRVKITKAIKVSLPTNFVDPNMQVFKGRTDESGNLNWVEPTNLPSPLTSRFAIGRNMFNNKCATCHAIGKPLTGPDLAHITRKRNREWLDAFTVNSKEVLASGDRLANCLYEQYNQTPMNQFTELTKDSLDILYEYIESQSGRLGIPYQPDNLLECLDSCDAYYEAMNLVEALKVKKEILVATNDPQVREIRTLPVPTFNSDTANLPRFVKPEHHQGVYYEFTIEEFGWFNIDILAKDIPGYIKSDLVVRIQGQYKTRLNVYLVVPSARVCGLGGKMDGKEDEYAFLTPDGKISLPYGNKACILVMGDSEETIVFAKQEFIITNKQRFDLTPAPITKEQFNREMRKLNYDQLNIRVADSKNAAAIRQTVKETKEAEAQAELLRPKGCDCNCGRKADTVAMEK